MRIIDLRSIKFKKIDVPFVVWIVVICTFFASAGTFSILGRQIVGWAWVIPLILSIMLILRKPSFVTFPVHIWLPWICIVALYTTISGFCYLQRNIMLICPIVVGMAVSMSRIREPQSKDFLALMRILLFTVFFTVIVRTGFIFTGILPSKTGLATQSMTAALLCCIFAAGYSGYREGDLFRWSVGVAVPIIALTRTAIAATGLTMPLILAPLGIRKRILFLIIIGVLSISLFYTERVQEKMFYSGSGSLEDIRLSNPDFFTTGRSRLWDLMIEEIKVKPLWGHGGNASEEFVLSRTWGTLTHPHNDWLRLLYDYGFVGTSAFAFCLAAQVIHLLKRARNIFGESKSLLYAGASSFLPFVLLMFTDNIILYSAFFGNLQFTILGLVYAAHRTQETDAWHYFNARSVISPVSRAKEGNKI